jgi:3-deoxy-manno-octulosonate cytidylyltransferase (CMP-KDO synthetase)
LGAAQVTQLAGFPILHRELKDFGDRLVLATGIPGVTSAGGVVFAGLLIETVGAAPEFVVNLQGDAPFTPAAHVVAIVDALATSGTDAATPYIRLSWEALDRLRAHKLETPFSGTTLVTDPSGRAIWFSKIILPAMRKEKDLRGMGPLSPVCQHVGLYAYRLAALRRYCALPESRYERLEGLEQLRLIENGLTVQAVEVQPGRIAIPGIDTAEDIALAERLVAAHGDPDGN